MPSDIIKEYGRFLRAASGRIDKVGENMGETGVYCAFLRGVNVGGRSMRMRDICDALRQAGMEDVSSIQASGNIVFRSDTPLQRLRGLLERAMSAHFGSKIDLFVKSGEQIEAILSASPFAADPGLHVYAFICEPGFEAVLMDEFRKITPISGERAAMGGGAFFWQVGKGKTLDAGFSKILGRRDMRDKFTSRNMSTLARIRDKINAR